MKAMRFGLEKGKVVLKEMKKKKKPVKPEIHYHITYENVYRVDSPEPMKVPVNKRFEYGICPFCENKFYIPDQKYCEECGIEL